MSGERWWKGYYEVPKVTVWLGVTSLALFVLYATVRWLG